MSENEEKKSSGVFSKTWVKVTAGVLGGTLVLGGTFAAGAGFGSKVDPRGLSNAVVAANFGSEKTDQMHGERGFRMQGSEQRSHRGESRDMKNLSESEQEVRQQMQLERLNHRLEKFGIDPLSELPVQLPNS